MLRAPSTPASTLAELLSCGRRAVQHAEGGGCAVAYLRVPIQRQGRSGLGLEAQRQAITRFAEAEGLTLTAEFVEVETGKGADALGRRPKLAEALASAREQAARPPLLPVGG
jgi:hypothetical protein